MTGASAASGPTAELARFVAGLDPAAISSAAVAQVKLSILDTIGCALHGASLLWCRMLQATIAEQGGAPQALVWGTTLRTSSTQAALANATAAHSFELDDVHMGGMIHPGALTLSAALAVAGRAGLSGAGLVTAMVAGCEVGARVGRAVGTAHFRAGFHPQGTVGAFAAAATACRALGLSAEQTQHALGIAGSQAAGLMAAQEGAMVKRLHSGHAAQAGVLSALLARRGFTGIADVLEAPFGGFCSTMGGGDVTPSKLVDGLGTRWESEQVGFKPYASCAAAQSSIEVVRLLKQQHRLVGDEVVSVVVRASTHSTIHCGFAYEPVGTTAAQMNIAYGLACMLRDGSVSAAHFSDACIRDPGLIEIARRVEVLPSAEIDALGSDHRYTVDVAIELSDGRTMHGHADDRPGGPSQPLAPEQVDAKFTGLASPVVGPEHAASIRRAVDRIEHAPSASLLEGLLAVAGSPADDVATDERAARAAAELFEEAR